MLAILYLAWDEVDLFLIRVPVIGPFYEEYLRPVTYYRIDTGLMFQSAVHGAVLEVIDGLTEAKGLRALSETERKPIMREVFGRGGRW